MRFAGPLTLVLGALALAGCQSNPLLVVRTSCPAVAVVKHTGTLTRFTGAARTQEQVEFSAFINGVNSNCTDATQGNGVTSDVTFDIVATRPDSKGALSATVPFFVVVMNEGTKMLAKQVYEANISFADGQGATSVRQRVQADTPRLPPPPPQPKRQDPFGDVPAPPRGTFEVLIGFQLNDRDAVYNITR
jgi:hypothetical protein